MNNFKKIQILRIALVVLALFLCKSDEVESQVNKPESKKIKNKKVAAVKTDIDITGKEIVTKELPKYQLLENEVSKNKFVYFSINTVDVSNFTISLEFFSGKGELYLNPEEKGLPNKMFFHEKGNSVMGTKIQMPPKKSTEKISEKYYIGIYGLENSDFNLLYIPNRDNLLQPKFQSLTKIKMEKGVDYYIDYYSKESKFSTLLYSENSDILVKVLDYDTKENEDIYSVYKDEKRYVQSFIFKEGDIPRKNSVNNPELVDKHIFIKIKALTSNAHVKLCIYNPDKPIKVHSMERFSFIMKESDEQTFEFKLDSKYSNIDFDIKLTFGAIDFSYGDNPERLKHDNSIKGALQKYFSFNHKKAVKNSKINIFKKFYIKVKALEYSKLSILVKPKNHFKKLHFLEPEIIKTASEKQFLYFEINPLDISYLHELNVKFEHDSLVKTEVNFYFSEDERSLNSNKNDLTKFEPTIEFDQIGDVTINNFNIAIKSGFYIIEIGKSDIQSNLKFILTPNNKNVISINSIYKGKQSSSKERKFLLYVPDKGEFRLIVESCKGIRIKSAEFFSHQLSKNTVNDFDSRNMYSVNSDKESINIQFDQIYQKEYPLLHIDETKDLLKEDIVNLDYPVERGYLNSKGILYFSVDKDASISDNSNEDLNFTLITEFRSFERQLNINNYFKISSDYTARGIADRHWVYNDKTKELEISVKVPEVIPDIIKDFPNVKIIDLKFELILTSDPDVMEKLNKCGLSCFNNVQNVKHVLTSKLKLSENFKTSSSRLTTIFSNFENYISAKDENLKVICYLGIELKEYMDEILELSLENPKMIFPYLLLSLPNPFYSKESAKSSSSATFVFIFFIVIAVIILVYYFKDSLSSKAQEEYGNYTFKRPSDIVSNNSNLNFEMHN